MTARPAPSGNGKPPELLTIITHPLQFKDGSRIRIVVEALKGHDFDQATNAYYNMALREHFVTSGKVEGILSL